MLSGCPPSTTRMPAPRSEPLENSIEISVDGDFYHSPSEMIFPEHVEGFSRVEITQYDKEGYDVSVGYNAYGLMYNLIATIYIYPGPEMTYLGAAPETVRSLESSDLSNEIERNVKFIEEQHPDWSLYYEGDSKINSSYPSRMASFEYQQETLTGPVKVISTVHIFLVDYRWFVKFRFTYPAASAEQYTPKVFNLVRSLTWPGEKPDNQSLKQTGRANATIERF